LAVASLAVVGLGAACFAVRESGADVEVEAAVFGDGVGDALTAVVAADEVVEVVSDEATFFVVSFVGDAWAVASLVVVGLGVACFAVRDSGAGVAADAVVFGEGVVDALAVWLVEGFVSAAFSGVDAFLVVSVFAVAAFAVPSVAAVVLAVVSFAMREVGAGVAVLATGFSGALFAATGSAAPVSRGRSSGARAFSHLSRFARSSSLSADDGAPAVCASTMRPANSAAKIRGNKNTNLTEGADFIRGECGPYTSVFAGHKRFSASSPQASTLTCPGNHREWPGGKPTLYRPFPGARHRSPTP
jgi:hypothetical protein